MNIDTNTLFSALSNEIHLRCLMLLQLEGELCVCELTHALDLSQPLISRHLALLRKTGLVNDRRADQWIYYCINPELPDWATTVLDATSQANMPNRPGSSCCA